MASTPVPTVVPTIPASACAADASPGVAVVVDNSSDLMRNDNSNPQQGTGVARAIPPAPPGASPPMEFHRPTFKIPPTKKDSRKLFVGGLPSDVTNEEFRTFFSQFGEVLDSIVMLDRLNGRSRGFGFVTYVDPTVSQRLLTMGNDSSNTTEKSNSPVGRIDMRGKMVEVKSAEPKEMNGGVGVGPFPNNRRIHQRRQPTPGRLPYGVGSAPIDPTMTMYGSGADYSSMYSQMQHHHHHHHQPPYYPPIVAGYMAPMYYPQVHPSAAENASVPPTITPPSVPLSMDNNYLPADMQPAPAYAFIPFHHPAHGGGYSPYGAADTAVSTSSAVSAPVGPSYHHAQGSAMHPAAPGIPPKEGEEVVDDPDMPR